MAAIGNIADVEELLQNVPSARELHAIWESLRPIPRPGQAQNSAITSGGWTLSREDLPLAHRFVACALEKEEYLLVLDAAREFLSIWEIAANENIGTTL